MRVKDAEYYTNESFNKEFCQHLEFHLCQTFANSSHQDLRRFWCDGVSWIPRHESHITKKHVNDTRMIETQAWLGQTGQDVYEMTIRLGKYALRRYAKGKSLIDCIPSEESMDWVIIDPENRMIELQLK
jgi:hypothetical protein